MASFVFVYVACYFVVNGSLFVIEQIKKKINKNSTDDDFLPADKLLEEGSTGGKVDSNVSSKQGNLLLGNVVSESFVKGRLTASGRSKLKVIRETENNSSQLTSEI